MTASSQDGAVVDKGGRSLLPWVALAVLMAIAAAYILYMGRGLTFFRDEWIFVIYRDGHDPANFLSSHAGHLLLWPTAFFVFMFKAVGLDHYELYRLAALPLHLACALLVYMLARRRVGDLVALAPAAILLFLGSSWMDILWPFQVGFTAAIAFGLAAILVFERDDLIGDALACLSLVVAIGWSGTALPFLLGVTVGLLLKRRLLKRIWVVAVPAVLYLAWLRRFGEQEQFDYASNALHAPAYALKMAGAGITGIVGLFPAEAGPYLAALLAVVVAVRLWQLGRSSPLAWQALAMALGFWFLTAAARAQDNDPGAVRYVYPSVVFLLLLAVGLAPRGAPRRSVTVAVLVLVALTLPANIAGFRNGRSDLRFTSNITSAELGAVELARDVVDPNYSPELNGFAGVPAGAFFAATDRYGSSPADAPAEIAASPDYARLGADAASMQALRVHLRRLPSGQSEQDVGRRCLALDGVPIVRTMTVPRRGILIGNDSRSPLWLGLRRFAAGFTVLPQRVPAGGEVLLRIAPDKAPQWPWRVRIQAPTGPVAVC